LGLNSQYYNIGFLANFSGGRGCGNPEIPGKHRQLAAIGIENHDILRIKAPGYHSPKD